MVKNKKNIIILTTVITILTAIIIFSILNWQTISFLFSQMTTGVEIVKEYVIDLGIIGIISIAIIIVACFFFPIISSVPIQLALAVSYGLWWGALHVTLSIFIASQILFLLSRSFRMFSTKKQIEQRKEIEEKIKNSKMSIYKFILLAYLAPFVPFLIIHTITANSGIKWWKYTIITLLGPVPDILVTLWAGVKITTSSSPIVSYIILVVIIVVVLLSTVFKNKMVDFIFKPKKENEIKEVENTNEKSN